MSVKFAFILGTWFGAGKSPFASGTVGSLCALPFAWFIMLSCGWLGLLGFCVLFYFIGVWCSDVIMKTTNTQDPGIIVIDEVVGMGISLLACPLNLYNYALAFVLFRIFDIFKPFPVSWADKKLKNATGVMLDDVFAGGYALGCFVAIKYFVHF